MADQHTGPTSQDLFQAAMVPQPAPEAPAEPPPQEPPPAEQPPALQPGEPPAVPPTPPPTPEAGVPSWRLREEAERARLAEERARMLEARLQEIATHLQQGQKQPDFFEDPGQATQRLILQTLQPYAEETRRNLMYMGKMVASATHGAERVEEAEQAFLTARANETLDPADYERVVQSPNRYDAVVQWHKRQSVLSSVGDDPEAWFNKQLEAKMADPQFQAKMIEKVQGSAAARPAMTRLPPSLSKSTSAANNRPEIGDLSDGSLWSFANKR